MGIMKGYSIMLNVIPATVYAGTDRYIPLKRFNDLFFYYLN